MSTLKLALKEAKAYTFYATNCEDGKTVTLRFENKEKAGLVVGSVVEVEVEKYGNEYGFISLISEKISDGRDKIIIDDGEYKTGDEYDGTIIFGVGSEFVKNGKKVQYAYFK